MPSIDFNEYAREMRELLDALLVAGEAVSVALHIEQQSSMRGFVEGEVHFDNGALLVVREFLDLTEDEPRLMYAYHCQDADGGLRFRYDNAAHRPRLGQADHKHTPVGIELRDPPSLGQVLREALS